MIYIIIIYILERKNVNKNMHIIILTKTTILNNK